MKSILGLLFLLISSVSVAQSYDSTGNLVNNIRGTSGHDVWLGTGYAADLGGVHPINVWGCCTSYSGASPVLDTSTLNGNGQSGQIIWSYGQSTVNFIANTVNATASYGSGLRIHGYSWSYDLRNMNGDDRQGSVDTLTATSRLWNSTYTGSGLASETRTHNTKMEWTTFGSTVTLATPQNLSNVGNLQLSFTSSDSGFWGGYYGPQIRNIQARLIYSVDPCVSDPQSSPSCPGFKTYYNIGDDGYALVPLPFTFPFYGQNFTTSYFQSNGVISFTDAGWGYCCSGPNLPQEGSNWNYTLLPLAVDLMASDPSSRFYTQNSDSYMRYTWENINQIGTNNLNTFSVEIRPTGYIGFTYNSVNVDGNTVTAGIAGNISQGQYKQIYHGAGNTFNLTGTHTFTGTEVDQCYIDPLSSITCAGYQQAFYNQQCSQDPLYDSGCPGYYQANYDLQCTITALYDAGCPGYQQAYFDQQCGLNPLYNNSCPGYEQAYFNQQCGLDPLYNNSCPGYAQAYFDQQCSLNSLYSESCPGYAQAYFDQQCGLDPFYNAQCPGYGAAVALKNLQEKQSESKNELVIADSTSSATASSVVDPTRSEASVTVDAGGAEISMSGEIIVPTGQTETSREAAKESERQEAKKDEDKKRPDPRAVAQARSAVEATNRLAESVAQEAVLLAQLDQTVSELIGLGTGISVQNFRTVDAEQSIQQSEREQSRTESKNNQSANVDLSVANNSAPKEVSGSQVSTGPSVRRGGAVEGMEGGANMSDLAKAPMDFNAYLNAQIKDSRFYESREIYRGQRTVDNARAQRFLNGASDRLHQEMVDQQYNIGAK
jgi:hypothetical protein